MAKLVYLLLALCISAGYSDPVGRKADDVRDYVEFLKNSVSGKPTPPATPDLEHLQNEWERSGKFEGDIILSEDQQEALVAEFLGSKNALIDTNRLWPGAVVHYAIQESDFTAAQIQAIRDAVVVMEGLSCLKFIERTTEPAYILVTGRDDGCYAAVGYRGTGGQTLNLTPNNPGSGCFRQGVIIHEFLHSLGFYHMQSTYDRDNYVEIIWENIRPGMEHNFNKYTESQVTNLGEEYDYGSVMHYTLYGFSINGERTIEPLQDTGDIVIGQSVGMSESDISRLNKLYC